MNKKVKIGLDFDGVIVYNPLRLARAPITYFKREVLGIKKLTFFVPTSKWQIFLWKIIHKSSYFPANGIETLQHMAKDPKYEFHLITARFGFLNSDLKKWLRDNKIDSLFSTININEGNEQPHVYKKRLIDKLQLDYYVDDNLNIINSLDGHVKARVLWINNLIDRILIKDRQGFPFLKAALLEIKKQV